MTLVALSDCLARAGRADASRADGLADAMAEHVATMTTGKLPVPAQAAWSAVARLLKARPDKPLPPPAIAAVRSWPRVRVDELYERLRELHAVLERIENERLDDQIRDDIRHHYL